MANAGLTDTELAALWYFPTWMMCPRGLTEDEAKDALKDVMQEIQADIARAYAMEPND